MDALNNNDDLVKDLLFESFDKSSDIAFVFNTLDENILAVNQQCSTIFGLKIGNTLADFINIINTTNNPTLHSVIRHYIEEDDYSKNLSFDWKYTDVNRGIVHLTIRITSNIKSNISILRGEVNNNHFINTNHIFEQEHRFKTLIENTPTGILFIDPEGIIIEVNQAMLNIIGSPSIKITKSINLLTFPSIEESGISADIKQCIDNGKPILSQKWYESRWGKRLFLEYFLTPIFNGNQLIGVLANVIDQTASKQAELELSENRELLKSILTAIPDIIFTLSGKGVVKDVFAANSNQQHQQIKSYIGKSIADYLGSENSEIVIEKISKAIVKNKIKHLEYEIINDHQSLWYEASIVPLVTKLGTDILWVARDITQQKETLNKLIMATDKAVESDKLKSTFLANMSHEIRTPLNGILGLTELLKDGDASPEDQQKYLNIISTRGYDLLEIINDIIDISKIEANQMKIEPIVFSVNQLIDKVFQVFDIRRKQLAKGNVQLTTATQLVNGNSLITADENRLQQILVNLVGNALKYTLQGEIEFGYKLMDNNQMLFYVKDTGIGIPHEKHQLIFEPFKQADNSHTRIFGGTGLGLSISKKLVELMNGDIWFESEPDRGSIFYFSIPYCPVHCEQAEEHADNCHPKIDNQSINWENKRVLIVEDDAISFMYLTSLLEKTKINIHHAGNGKEAVELFTANPDFDIILMDIQLPIMDGYDVTRYIRKANNRIPIIAQTAHAMQNDRTKIIQAGCNDYITKPIDPFILLHKMSQHLTLTYEEK